MKRGIIYSFNSLYLFNLNELHVTLRLKNKKIKLAEKLTCQCVV